MEKFNADGGTEMAAMSTSCSKDIALRYAASRRPLLFQYRAKGLTKGVMIDFLSVYPKEKECLYPPGTYLQPRKMWKEGGVRVVEVEPQIPYSSCKLPLEHANCVARRRSGNTSCTNIISAIP